MFSLKIFWQKWWRGETRVFAYREKPADPHVSEEERMAELAALIESEDVSSEKLELIAKLMGHD